VNLTGPGIITGELPSNVNKLTRLEKLMIPPCVLKLCALMFVECVLEKKSALEEA